MWDIDVDFSFFILFFLESILACRIKAYGDDIDVDPLYLVIWFYPAQVTTKPCRFNVIPALFTIRSHLPSGHQHIVQETGQSSKSRNGSPDPLFLSLVCARQ